MRSFAPRVLCLLFLTLLPALNAAEATVTIPPEPAYPARDKLDKEAFKQQWALWKVEHDKWENSLTAAQTLALKNQKPRPSPDETTKKYEKGQRLPLPEDGYYWKDTATERKLDAALVSSLEKHKMAFGPAVRQSFDPYLGGPVFITSDSLLNGFHVLLEDSVREIEMRHALGMRAKLEELLVLARELPTKEKVMDPSRAAKALRHLQLLLGPAMLLSGSSADLFDAELRAEIEAQTALLRQASSVQLPAWLAPEDPDSLVAIDYGRCKPVGLYAGNPRLSAYFAAIRWLQMVPLRAGREHEFDAMVLASLSIKGNYPNQHHLGDWFRSLTEFFGRGDDPGPDQLCEALDNRWPRGADSYDSSARAVQNTLSKVFIESGYYEINSDLRASRTGAQTFASLSFRLVPAVKLPDARLFQQLLDAHQRPSGLGVAAMLGSPFALAQLDPGQRAVVERHGPWTPPKGRYGKSQAVGVYENYLNALAALFLPAEAAAPEFMRSPLWALKNCQTALAGWAQMRHTFTLQAKMNMNYFGLISCPPGFVEPNPEFFNRVARLIAQTSDSLEAASCFRPDPQARAEDTKLVQKIESQGSLARRWKTLERISRTLESLAHKQLRGVAWTREEEQFLKRYGEEMAGIMGYEGNSWLTSRDDAPRWVEVCGYPQEGKSLAVGVGRPRKLFVLYPWNGLEILCVGSVMQYYEYDSDKRLTDPEWLQLLDSPAAPPLPAWLAPHASPPGVPAKGH